MTLFHRPGRNGTLGMQKARSENTRDVRPWPMMTHTAQMSSLATLRSTGREWRRLLDEESAVN